jgi:hypothetical protein
MEIRKENYEIPLSKILTLEFTQIYQFKVLQMIEELGQMLLLTDIQLITWYAAIKAYLIYRNKVNSANDANRFNIVNKKKSHKAY